MRMTQLEIIRHIPNPLALATSLRGGDGPHNTSKKQNRRDRKTTRQELRRLEG